MPMEVRILDSILTSIKLKVGLDANYDVFDDVIIDSINAAFFVLWQLGVGRDTTNPFMIKDATSTWNDFIDEGMAESVKDYIGKRVKLVFDPPSNSFLVENIKTQIEEDGWRLTVAMDEYRERKKTEERS